MMMMTMIMMITKFEFWLTTLCYLYCPNWSSLIVAKDGETDDGHRLILVLQILPQTKSRIRRGILVRKFDDRRLHLGEYH